MSNLYKDDLVSVIMPCYNAHPTITESIESVLSQSYRELELIIIDDSSTVNSTNYVLDYLEDPRVKLILLNKNIGPAVARNRGILKAEGRYVAFLDSDDVWKQTKLEKQLNYMKKTSSPFSFTAYQMMNEDGSRMLKTIQVPQKITYKELLKNTIIGCSTVVIDRSLVGIFLMPDIRRGEDTATWLKILKKGYIASGIQEPLTNYRVLEGSFSRNKWKMLQSTWKMYRQTQHLSVIRTSYYFYFYAMNAIKKRIF